MDTCSPFERSQESSSAYKRNGSRTERFRTRTKPSRERRYIPPFSLSGDGRGWQRRALSVTTDLDSQCARYKPTSVAGTVSDVCPSSRFGLRGWIQPIARRAEVCRGGVGFCGRMSCRLHLAVNRTCVAPRQQVYPVAHSNDSGGGNLQTNCG